MKPIFVYLILLFSFCVSAQKNEKTQVAQFLDDWHRAAAEANFERYFSGFASDGVFIGTDPTEHWDIEAFKQYAKPHFDRARTWDFKAVDRHIYFSDDGAIIWFDELLDTQMKLCRGSGVLVRSGESYLLKQYVLSIAIPNDATQQVIGIKAAFDEVLLDQLKKKNLVKE